MASKTIPLFPLHVVVFPRTSLPLHIFEERYKEMVGNAIRENSEFGVVLAKGGGIVNTGCTVAVEKILQMYPDGRMDLVTRGRSRFEVVTLSEEKACLEAEVVYFDDDDIEPTPEEVRNEAVGHYKELQSLSGPDQRGEPDLDDRQVSFQLAQLLPDLDFLGALLRLRSETGRLKALNHYLSQYIPRQRAIGRMKALAPRNGCGARPAGL